MERPLRSPRQRLLLEWVAAAVVIGVFSYGAAADGRDSVRIFSILVAVAVLILQVRRHVAASEAREGEGESPDRLNSGS